MKVFKIIMFLVAVLLPVSAAADWCPDSMYEFGDQDGDGFLNNEDACCFVASLTEDATDALCSFSEIEEESLDLNGNGIPFSDEETCCVMPADDDVSINGGYCHVMDGSGGDECGDGMLEVPCDKLLMYNGMLIGPDAEEPAYCGDSGCLCFTVGDYDGDGNTIEDIGPFDNCPKTSSADQGNLDGDQWGNPCDNCEEEYDSAYGCELFEDMCDPGSYCALWAFRNAGGTGYDEYRWVGYNCTRSPDWDGDHAGDMCDNCLEVWNEDQSNMDDDSAGDECDPCPYDAYDPYTTGELQDWEDFDDDGIADLCDNCVETPNWDQEDTDGDSLGDLCDNCPGTFNPEQTDGDDDNWGDFCDNCPEDSNPDQSNIDDDEWGDVCDTCPDGQPLYADEPDSDLDGIVDSCDNCPDDENSDQANDDLDGFGNECDECPEIENWTHTYTDGDTYPDECDNCYEIDNEDQLNSDEDAFGDVCDNCADKTNLDQANDDEDTLGNACDNCPFDTNEDQYNSDGDNWGEECDNCPCCVNNDQLNDDDDAFGNVCDNCPHVANDDQCDDDDDGVGNLCDNCEEIYNPDQNDENMNGVGDACETFVDEYTGAFNFSCSSARAASSPMSILGLLF